MRIALLRVTLCCALVWPLGLSAQSTPASPQSAPQEEPTKATELFALANQSRAQNNLGTLQWDDALAKAALGHCLRMAVEGPIEHRYPGEQDLTSRTGAAGAHFSVIEENVAVGSHIATIHQGWLDSPEHRANLLNAEIDRIGIAVVGNQGVLFAVADYARAVPVLTQSQVEAAFAALLRAKKITVMRDSTDARTYCNSSGKYSGNESPSFVVLWQNPDVTQLPQRMVEAVDTGRYRRAEVGSCPAQNVNGPFTVYRVAVLLFE